MYGETAKCSLNDLGRNNLNPIVLVFLVTRYWICLKLKDLCILPLCSLHIGSTILSQGHV